MPGDTNKELCENQVKKIKESIDKINDQVNDDNASLVQIVKDTNELRTSLRTYKLLLKELPEDERGNDLQRELGRTILETKKHVLFRCNCQVFLYNSKLNKARDFIDKLSDDDSRKEELNSRIGALSEFSLLRDIDNCQTNIDVSVIEKLEQYFGKLGEIEKKLGEKLIQSEKDNALEYFKEHVEHIKDKINKIGVDKVAVMIDIELLDSLNISDSYKKELEELKDLYSKKTADSAYEELKGKLNFIVAEVKTISDEYYQELAKKVEGITSKFVELVKDIESAYNNKALDGNQYKNLVKRVDDIKDSINKQLKEIENIKNNGVSAGEKDTTSYENIENDINKINSKLDELINGLNNYDRLIKEEDRPKINDSFTNIEKIINDLEEKLKLVKGKDSEKEKRIQDKIKEAKDKLDDAKTIYQSKCPPKVTKVKDAKPFFKKYNKLIVLGSGIACTALALSHLPVSGILIPSIIAANMYLIGKYPLFDNINDILGRSINAVKDKFNNWKDKRGFPINAMSSVGNFFKAIAVSTYGFGARVTKKLVDGVKNVFNMTPTEEYKKSMEELSARQTEAYNQNLQKEEDIKIVKLYNKFISSELSLEEFYEINDLSDKEKEDLESYIAYKKGRTK